MTKRALHVVMPMAGEGTRFSRAGWVVPKPLINIDGKPAFWHAANSISPLSKLLRTKYSFIVRKDHQQFDIENHIRSFFPEANIFYVDHSTRGAVETCLYAEPTIKDEEGILILDCDLEFKSTSFYGMIQNVMEKQVDWNEGGILLSFDNDSPRYSYAVIDESGFVLLTAEKRVISKHALCGAYFICSGHLFKSVAHQLIDDNGFVNGEFYVSLLFNILIRRGKKVRIAYTEEYRSFGTPEELVAII